MAASQPKQKGDRLLITIAWDPTSKRFEDIAYDYTKDQPTAATHLGDEGLRKKYEGLRRLQGTTPILGTKFTEVRVQRPPSEEFPAKPLPGSFVVLAESDVPDDEITRYPVHPDIKDAIEYQPKDLGYVYTLGIQSDASAEPLELGLFVPFYGHRSYSVATRIHIIPADEYWNILKATGLFNADWIRDRDWVSVLERLFLRHTGSIEAAKLLGYAPAGARARLTRGTLFSHRDAGAPLVKYVEPTASVDDDVSADYLLEPDSDYDEPQAMELDPPDKEMAPIEPYNPSGAIVDYSKVTEKELMDLMDEATGMDPKLMHEWMRRRDAAKRAHESSPPPSPRADHLDGSGSRVGEAEKSLWREETGHVNPAPKRDRPSDLVLTPEDQPVLKRAKAATPEDAASALLLSAAPELPLPEAPLVDVAGEASGAAEPETFEEGRRTLELLRQAKTHSDKIQVLQSKGGYHLTQSDLDFSSISRLRSPCLMETRTKPQAFYLNDRIIVAYWNLVLRKFSDEYRRRHPGSDSVFDRVQFIDPTSIQLVGESAKARISRLCENIERKWHWVWPVHHANLKHWSLLIIDWATKNVAVYDSLNRSSEPTTKIVRDWLATGPRPYPDAVRAFIEAPDTSFQHTGLHDVLQNNGFDCGVFVCHFMYFHCKRQVYQESKNSMMAFVNAAKGSRRSEKDKAVFARQLRKIIAYELIYDQIVKGLHAELVHSDTAVNRAALLFADLKDKPLRDQVPGFRLWFEALPRSKIPSNIERQLPAGFGSASEEISAIHSLAEAHEMDVVFDGTLRGSDILTLRPDYVGRPSVSVMGKIQAQLFHYKAMFPDVFHRMIELRQGNLFVLTSVRRAALNSETQVPPAHPSTHITAIQNTGPDKDRKTPEELWNEASSLWPQFVDEHTKIAVNNFSTVNGWNVANIQLMLMLLCELRDKRLSVLGAHEMTVSLGDRLQASQKLQDEMSRLLTYIVVHGLAGNEHLLVRFYFGKELDPQFDIDAVKVLLATDLALGYQPANPRHITTSAAAPPDPDIWPIFSSQPKAAAKPQAKGVRKPKKKDTRPSSNSSIEDFFKRPNAAAAAKPKVVARPRKSESSSSSSSSGRANRSRMEDYFAPARPRDSESSSSSSSGGRDGRDLVDYYSARPAKK